MFARFLIGLAALSLPAQAFAQDLEGHWALRIDEATIFVFALEQDADGDWSGSWTRPAEIESNGAVFRRMRGSETVEPSDVRQTSDAVQLTFEGPEGTRRNDVLRFALVADNRAELVYQGIPGDPYPLIRVRPDTPLGPFEAAHIYDRDNAVTEADYSEAEPELDETGEGDEEAGESEDEQPRIEADFLEGI